MYFYTSQVDTCANQIFIYIYLTLKYAFDNPVVNICIKSSKTCVKCNNKRANRVSYKNVCLLPLHFQ